MCEASEKQRGKFLQICVPFPYDVRTMCYTYTPRDRYVRLCLCAKEFAYAVDRRAISCVYICVRICSLGQVRAAPSATGV